METTKLSSKGQVIIPKGSRQAHDWKPGLRFVVEDTDAGLLLRPLPDFPAWQTYGPLFHARCGIDQCVARQNLEKAVPLAIRYLIHDAELAESALQAVGDAAPELLKALALTSDPDLGEYSQRYEKAYARYRELRDEWDKAADLVAKD